MFRLARALAALLLALCSLLAWAERFPGVGRAATAAEVSAWDIDVRPDFLGLPVGSGTVAQGQVIWEGKCANCHGVFGESNEIFTPIVGGTTQDDIKTGRVAALTDQKQPQRTTLMKVATLSSLFDYIRRAMPWNAPRSLSDDETYAVLAYVLNLAEIVPDDFTLSNRNMAEVQQRMPNRNGMTRAHGLWSIKSKPDVQGSTCMTNCVAFVQIGSTLPDYARNAHNNLAEQNRAWGPYRGVDTTQPPLVTLPSGTLAASKKSAIVTVSPRELFGNRGCASCHAANSKVVGPALRDIASRYRTKPDARTTLAKKIREGGSGVWGSIPMPEQTAIADGEILVLIDWILEGKF